MLEKARLYFIPSRGEFLKIQPGTGDNLSPEDIEAGFTDYVIWNRFRAECLDIDGELPMECVDSGMVLLDSRFRRNGKEGTGMTGKGTQNDDLLREILEQAYGEREIMAFK